MTMNSTVDCVLNSTCSAGASTSVNVGGIIAIIVFYLLILCIGIFASWKTRSMKKNSTEDVILAGRNIGLFVGIFTMTATWVGGGYINGTAEFVFTPGYGLVWTQAPVGYAISLVLGGLLFAKPMREAKYITMLDPLEKRFGAVMAAFLYLPALTGEIFWSAAILSALGASLRVILNLARWVAILVSAAIAVLYTLLGGLYSVAYTDVIQLICIFLGLWLCIPFAMTNEAVDSITSTSKHWLGSLPPDHSVSMFIDTYLLLIFGGIPWQVYFQRVLSSKSAKRAQILSFTAALGCLIMAVPAVLIGAIGASADWEKTSYGKKIPEDDYGLILPLVMNHLTPVPVAVIGLGAVSAAVMSSADSSIFSASTMFAQNVYRPIREALFKTKADKEVVWVMRISVVFVAAAAVGMAIAVKSIYGLWYLCADFVYVILFPHLLCAVHIPYTNWMGSLAGFKLGLIFRLTGGEHYLNFYPAIKYIWYDPVDNWQYFPFKTMSMLICLVSILIFSLPLYIYRKVKNVDYVVNSDEEFNYNTKGMEMNQAPERGYANQAIATEPSENTLKADWERNYQPVLDNPWEYNKSAGIVNEGYTK